MLTLGPLGSCAREDLGFLVSDSLLYSCVGVFGGEQNLLWPPMGIICYSELPIIPGSPPRHTRAIYFLLREGPPTFLDWSVALSHFKLIDYWSFS